MARRESIQSLCAAARRVGECLVVLGQSNTRILVQYDYRTMSYRWFVDGWQTPQDRVCYLLEQLQQDEPA
jgi:hypothetical protein